MRWKYKPPAGSQLTETRYAIIACLESTRRCESAPVVSSRSMEWVIPKPGKVGFESCRLVHGLCDFSKALHRGLSGGTVARIIVVLLRVPTSTAGETEQWLHTWHWRHAVDTRASHLLMKVWTWQTLLVRWTEETEDVIQPRLREIDRFFFRHAGDGDFSLKCWLQTE